MKYVVSILLLFFLSSCIKFSSDKKSSGSTSESTQSEVDSELEENSDSEENGASDSSSDENDNITNENTETSEDLESDIQSIVDSTGDGDYLSLSDALADDAKNILIKNGIYEVNESIVVESSGVIITGESKEGVQLIQKNTEKDLLVVKANGVRVSNITLDTLTYNAQAAFVEAGASYIVLENNIIKGGDNIFTVYFAGPPVSSEGSNCEGCIEKDETIDVYLENGESSYSLSYNNHVLNNSITSTYPGDGVSFALQKNGRFAHNEISGAMLSVYMVKDTRVFKNTLSDSLQSGIYLTLPSENVVIDDNVINNPVYHGVIVKPQYSEHGHVGENILSQNIEITNNDISANVYGISVEGYGSGYSSWGRLEDVLVYNNRIVQKDFTGIFYYNLSVSQINENLIDFADCSKNYRGIDFNEDGESDTPEIASRSSSGIHLYNNLSSINISENLIRKSDTCSGSEPLDLDDLGAGNINIEDYVMQNAISIGDEGSTVAHSIDSINIVDNEFVNEVDDWVHSNTTILNDTYFIGDYSDLDAELFGGIDMQDLSFSSEIESSGNVNVILNP